MTNSVEDAHELHEGLCVTLFSGNGLNFWFYLLKELVQL